MNRTCTRLQQLEKSKKTSRIGFLLPRSLQTNQRTTLSSSPDRRGQLPKRTQPSSNPVSTACAGSGTDVAQASGKLSYLHRRRHGIPEPTQQLVIFEDLADQMLDASRVINLPAAEAVKLVNFTNKNLDRLVAKLGRIPSLWRRVLVLHEWLLLVGHTPDARLCTSVMRVCCANNEGIRSLTLFDWMQSPPVAGGPGLEPNVFTYTVAVKAAVQSGQPARAEQIWRQSLASGCRPDSHLVRAAMEARLRVGDPDAALELFDQFEALVGPSVHMSNSAMKAAVAAGKPALALDLFERIDSASPRASLEAYTTAISACTALGNPDRAGQLFEAACRAGLRPDCQLYTAHATAWASRGEWRPAVEVLISMTRSGVRPSEHTHLAVIEAMVRAGEVDRALRMLRNMQLPDWGSVRPNAHIHSCLIRGLGRHHRYACAKQLFLAVLCEAGIGRGPFGGSHGLGDPPDGDPLPPSPELNEVVVGAMLGACEGCGEWEDALRLLEWVEAGGVPGVELNAVMVNACLSALGKAGQWRAAEGVFRRHSGLCDRVSRETMALAYGWAGQAREAEGMVKNMLSRGETPSDYAFSGVVAAYRISNRPRRAFQIRSRMRVLGIPPSVHVYNELLLVCERQQMWDKALELIQAMQREGVEPNKTTHDILVVVRQEGMKTVEDQQAAAAALSAVATVAGAFLLRTGLL